MTTTNLIISDNDPIISIYCGTTISEKKKKKNFTMKIYKSHRSKEEEEEEEEEGVNEKQFQ